MKIRDLRRGAVRLAAITICSFTTQLVAQTSAQALPTGWTFLNVGNPAIVGSATYTSGTFSIRAAGIDSWSTPDQFAFVNRPVSGNATIVARVAKLQNVNAWSTAGLMIRQSPTTGSKSAGNRPPAVSLTAPTDGATYTAPANIPLAATASDRKGTIARVDFYAGASLLGTDTSEPYEYTWSRAPAGQYAITAVARDQSGAMTTSEARNVTVSPAGSNQAPLVSLTAPAAGRRTRPPRRSRLPRARAMPTV